MTTEQENRIILIRQLVKFREKLMDAISLLLDGLATGFNTALRNLSAETVHFEPTTDPAEGGLVDEYQQIKGELYQALGDAVQVRETAQAAASLAQQKAQAAASAASDASNAAMSANNAALSADNAAQQIEDARGEYPSLSERISATEIKIVLNDDPMSLLNI